MRNNTRVRYLISIFVSVLAGIAACQNEPRQESADIVLINGGIYTVDSERRWAEAAAVRGGEIIAVGSNRTIERLADPSTRVIDLSGRMALPGLHDSHIHPLEGAYEQVFCDVSGAGSIAGLIDTLNACPEQPGDWFQALGLDLSLFGMTGPDNSILEKIRPDKYVFVDGADGHAALVNGKLLQLIGFDSDTTDPAGGVIERRPGSKEPSGTIRETARDAADKLRPRRTLEVSRDVMLRTLRRMNSLGITSIIDMWAGEHEWRVYQSLASGGDLSLRVTTALIDEGVFEKHSGPDFERVLAARHDFDSELIDNNSIKIMVDGVFEGETAAVLEPYDSADHLGILNHTPEELNRRVLRYYDMGLNIHFHTMGDRAARAALDALEYAYEQSSRSRRQQRHSLSHLGLIDPADMPRFPALTAAASFTPVWAGSDDWTLNLEIPALGQERVDKLYPLRSVQAAGAVIVGSSDWNYGALDPLLSVETAVTRQVAEGEIRNRSVTTEAIDLGSAIAAYTINGAWLTHRDDRAGSIEPGKFADIVVLNRNLFEIPAAEISETVVDLTLLAGRVVYERQQPVKD